MDKQIQQKNKTTKKMLMWGIPVVLLSSIVLMPLKAKNTARIHKIIETINMGMYNGFS
jgi:HlyD family secretion protein